MSKILQKLLDTHGKDHQAIRAAWITKNPALRKFLNGKSKGELIQLLLDAELRLELKGIAHSHSQAALTMAEDRDILRQMLSEADKRKHLKESRKQSDYIKTIQEDQALKKQQKRQSLAIASRKRTDNTREVREELEKAIREQLVHHSDRKVTNDELYRSLCKTFLGGNRG